MATLESIFCVVLSEVYANDISTTLKDLNLLPTKELLLSRTKNKKIISGVYPDHAHAH